MAERRVLGEIADNIPMVPLETRIKQVKTHAQRAAQRREGTQFMLRLPPGMKEKLAERANKAGRSMCAEVIQAIERHLDLGDDQMRSLERRVLRLEQQLEETYR